MKNRWHKSMTVNHVRTELKRGTYYGAANDAISFLLNELKKAKAAPTGRECHDG